MAALVQSFPIASVYEKEYGRIWFFGGNKIQCLQAMLPVGNVCLPGKLGQGLFAQRLVAIKVGLKIGMPRSEIELKIQVAFGCIMGHAA